VVLSTFWEVMWGGFLFFFIVLPIIMLWVFALADLFRRKDSSPISRVIWLLVIIFFPIFGSLIYLLVRPPAEEIQYR
jgi:ATP/ADP translocase